VLVVIQLTQFKNMTNGTRLLTIQYDNTVTQFQFLTNRNENTSLDAPASLAIPVDKAAATTYKSYYQ
jgi:hypothetical protein